MKYRLTSVLSAVALVSLAACGGNSNTSSGGAGAGAPAETPLFGLPHGSIIATTESSASFDKGSDDLVQRTEGFFFKARDADTKRVVRYGRVFAGYDGRRHYEIPIALANSGGVVIGSGTATFTGPVENQADVTSRTITISDIKLSDSIFGVFTTEDTGTRGDFYDVHAYAAGVAATGLPASATYTGTFLGKVLSSDFGTTGTTDDLQLDANLTVVFGGANTVTGTIGATGSPDITITGTIAGTSIAGTAMVASTGITLANGSTGTVTGGFFGAGAANAAGTIAIEDSSGAVEHQLVGGFGATKN